MGSNGPKDAFPWAQVIFWVYNFTCTFRSLHESSSKHLPLVTLQGISNSQIIFSQEALSSQLQFHCWFTLGFFSALWRCIWVFPFLYWENIEEGEVERTAKFPGYQNSVTTRKAWKLTPVTWWDCRSLEDIKTQMKEK